jgi:hypothetical protein
MRIDSDSETLSRTSESARSRSEARVSALSDAARSLGSIPRIIDSGGGCDGAVASAAADARSSPIPSGIAFAGPNDPDRSNDDDDDDDDDVPAAPRGVG